MKVQIFLEAGLPPKQVNELGLLAEGYGIDTVYASAFPARRDAFQCLSALAVNSSSVRVGVVPLSPFEVHPVRLSDMLQTLNDMSDGRASLVVGGMGQSIMRATGLKPDRRVRAVRECVEILRAASGDEPVDYEGEIYSAMNYFPDWTHAVPPHILVGANGPMMLRAAGEVADGVMMSDVALGKMPEVLGHIDQGLAERGFKRSVDSFPISNFFAWHIKASAVASIAEARRELVWRGVLQKWYTEPFLGGEQAEFVEANFDAFLQAFYRRSPDIEGIPEEIIQALVDNLTFSGGIDAIPGVVKHLKAFSVAGLDAITLKIHDNPEEAIGIIGEHLIPQLMA
ncbi:MAG: LLM class flavin-dependent oxidoreductase [Gammaproteobacteria bacterium]|nr:LLM class flavin-dependent oxidoreductase [Gammaproteobacteria bacterium]